MIKIPFASWQQENEAGTRESCPDSSISEAGWITPLGFNTR
jgi:hypothetical protein